ncbi:hypothetical protein N665_0098s0022, partial [Sinapis alba]
MAVIFFSLVHQRFPVYAGAFPRGSAVGGLPRPKWRKDRVQEVGFSVFEATHHVLQVVDDALKPALDSAFHIAKQSRDVGQHTTKAMEDAKPIASSTIFSYFLLLCV